MKTFLRGNESLHEPNPYKRVWARAERKLLEGYKTIGFKMKEVKKLFCINVLLLLIFSQISFVLAQEDIIEDVASGELVNKFAENNNYLIKEWKNILLQNRFVSGADSFLQKISFIFVFLFGEPYSFSLTLGLVMVLWIFFFVIIAKLIKNHTPFPKYLQIIISFALVIMLAQFQSLHRISEMIIWFVMSREALIWRVISIVGLILILVLVSWLLNKYGALIEASKEKKAKAKEKVNRTILDKFTQGITKGLSK